MFDSTLTTQEKEIIDGCMEVVITNPNLDLCRIIAKLNIQLASMRAQLYAKHEPEDHKEYSTKRNTSKTLLAKKVTTKYGN